MPAELLLEPSSRTAGLGLSQSFERSAVLEESGSATGGARVSGDGGFHVESIGIASRFGNPWRE